MFNIAKSAATFLFILIAGFYAFMYFRAGSVEFPYHLLPDAVKLDRMVAAELMQCALRDPDLSGIVRLGAGFAGNELVTFLAQATTRSEIIAARDEACAEIYKAQKAKTSFTNNAGKDEAETNAATKDGAAVSSPNGPATVAPTVPRPATVAPTVPRPATVAPTVPRPATVAPTVPRPATVAPTVPRPTQIPDDRPQRNRETPLLTARFENMPDSHDGRAPFTFELRFSEEIRLSYKSLRDDAFVVNGGIVERARRMNRPSNIRWEITVRPEGIGPVTIMLDETADCAVDGAICTADGRTLSTKLVSNVTGP